MEKVKERVLHRKIKVNSTSNKCIKQRKPIVNCKRFIENPQKFFTEDLCDNVLNSYNLKPPNKHTHTRSKSTSNINITTTNKEQRLKRKTKSNNISPTKQPKTNISTTTTTTSSKPKTKVIGNITLDIIPDINDTSISHPKHKRKHSI